MYVYFRFLSTWVSTLRKWTLSEPCASWTPSVRVGWKRQSNSTRPPPQNSTEKWWRFPRRRPHHFILARLMVRSKSLLFFPYMYSFCITLAQFIFHFYNTRTFLIIKVHVCSNFNLLASSQFFFIILFYIIIRHQSSVSSSQ